MYVWSYHCVYNTPACHCIPTSRMPASLLSPVSSPVATVNKPVQQLHQDYGILATLTVSHGYSSSWANTLGHWPPVAMCSFANWFLYSLKYFELILLDAIVEDVKSLTVTNKETSLVTLWERNICMYGKTNYINNVVDFVIMYCMRFITKCDWLIQWSSNGGLSPCFGMDWTGGTVIWGIDPGPLSKMYLKLNPLRYFCETNVCNCESIFFEDILFSYN